MEAILNKYDIELISVHLVWISSQHINGINRVRVLRYGHLMPERITVCGIIFPVVLHRRAPQLIVASDIARMKGQSPASV